MKKGPVSLFLLLFFLFSGFLYLESYLVEVELPSDKKPLLFYSTQLKNDLESTLCEAISSANDSIYLAIYALSDPAVLAALNEKAKSCRIKVICDKNASSRAAQQLDSRIRVVKRRAEGLMHLKALVIDEQISLIGSANFTRSSLLHQENLVIGMKSSKLAKELIEHLEKMGSTNKRQGRLMSCSLGKSSLDLSLLPNPEESERIKSLIRTARKTLRVAMFTWTRSDFAEEVIAAKRRGVDVKVILDRHAARGAGKKIAALLAQEKIPLFLYEGSSLLHHKMAWIDGETLVSGSANWTSSAFKKNDDCFLVVRGLTGENKKRLRRLWKRLELENSRFFAARERLGLPSD